MQQGRRHASSASLESLRLTRNRQRAKIVQKESTPRHPTPHLVKCAMRERPLEVLLEAHPARNALWESGLMTLLLFVKNVRRGQSAGRMIHGPCASPAAPQRPRRARRVRPGAFGVRRERKPATPQRCASLASSDDFVLAAPRTPRLVWIAPQGGTKRPRSPPLVPNVCLVDTKMRLRRARAATVRFSRSPTSLD